MSAPVLVFTNNRRQEAKRRRAAPQAERAAAKLRELYARDMGVFSVIDKLLDDYLRNPRTLDDDDREGA